MAFSVRVEAFGIYAQKPWFTLEPGYWDASELMRDPRFELEPEMEGYDDYVARLNVDEFEELHEKYKVKAEQESGSGKQWIETIRSRITKIERAIQKTRRNGGRFRVVLFEWWSGFGD